MNRTKLAASLALTALLAACASSAPPAPPAPVENRTAPPTNTGPTTSAVQPDAGTSSGMDSGQMAGAPNGSVYFDYDQYVIKDEFRGLMDSSAAFLKKNAGARVLVQGNADERGSREYNLALGQKRANAVKSALEVMGVDSARVEAVSLGEEKPACEEKTEDCYAKNRRADFVYQGK